MTVVVGVAARLIAHNTLLRMNMSLLFSPGELLPVWQSRLRAPGGTSPAE
jgi:hypothetical protein